MAEARVELIERSYFSTKARGNGSLILTEIGATIDHGDESDITGFVVAYLRDQTEVVPGVTMQSLLAGGEMQWTSDGIIVLLITDPDDNALKQAVMQTFLQLSMISGRFRPDEETQRHIFADRTTGALASLTGGKVVPEAWFAALDSDAPWNAAPFLPAGGGPWQPEDFPEWVGLVS